MADRASPFIVRTIPLWVRQALNLTRSDVPQRLAYKATPDGDFAEISSTLDLFQGGVAIGQPIVGNPALNSAVAQVQSLYPPGADPNYGFMLYALDVTGGAFAATRNPLLGMQPVTPLPNGTYISLSQFGVAANTRVPWRLASAGGAGGTGDTRIYIPPGFVPVIDLNDLVNETLTVRFVMYRIPAGFRPY